ncbi:PrsW family intramembrane metalloprotease [Arthrobacter tumbae]|uniref:PrsW family intramembrane metalloprotease n=1 Tax=Arthrobacter tumbae TaxID=163874 RepID=UPI0019580B18|nr:PrsW family intramembrane metalloprotease [Arthrobacter tumbae]MBM7783210.1 RsiW-degrading membrane proteinase PrsW (M82 family) [Arthrobacter tumbae]
MSMNPGRPYSETHREPRQEAPPPLGMWQQVSPGPPVPPPAHRPIGLVPPGRKRSSPAGAAVVNGLLLIFAALVLGGVAVLVTLQLGTAALVLCAALALVPLAICLAGIRWVDRWDPEPRGALTFAFLWGAGMSVAVTLLLGPTVTALLSAGLDGASPDVVGPVFQAPLVEEAAKGLGVLILALSRRSHFDGPVDGIVYAGTVAAGFAFTENVLYFGAALTDPAGLGGLVTVFVMRGLFSPFAHVMFSGALGLVLGMAVAKGRGKSRLAGAFLLGLLPSIAGHMLWNGGLLVLFNDFFSFYFLVQVPLFLVVIAVVLGLRRAERAVTYQRLAEYSGAGWLTNQELEMVAAPRGRSSAIAWARGVGAGAGMKQFISTGVRLAFVRQRLRAGHATAFDPQLEVRLLHELDAARRRIITAASARRV